MKPAPFDYLRPDSLDEAIVVLQREGDEARVLAGGQSLLAVLNMRLARPALLVDVSGLQSHRTIRAVGGALEVGLAATQAMLEGFPGLARLTPVLAQALPHLGHFQTRNKGTVCGSIAHADPTSELPLCLALLEGEVVLASTRGRRRLRAAEFQQGMLTTARQSDEIVEAVRFPLARPGSGYAFREMAERHGDFAIVAVAAEASASAVRLAIAGMADRPVVRQWPGLAERDLEDALNDLAWELKGSDDAHASAVYRRELLRRLGRQAIMEAHRCRD